MILTYYSANIFFALLMFAMIFSLLPSGAACGEICQLAEGAQGGRKHFMMIIMIIIVMIMIMMMMIIIVLIITMTVIIIVMLMIIMIIRVIIMILMIIIKQYHDFDDPHSFDHEYDDADNDYDRPHNHDHETCMYKEDDANGHH